MKRLFNFFIFLLLAMAASAQAPTLTDTDMPHAGDKYFMSNATPNSIAVSQLADVGVDMVWDFDLQPTTQQTDTMFDNNDVPFVYQFAFLQADYADNTAPDLDLPIPGFPISVSDIYNFYNLTSAKLELMGFGATINGLNTPVIFTSKDKLYELPLEYGNTYASVAAFGIDIPTLGAWYETRDRNSVVDAWGTLSGPLGDQQVLRVKSDINYVDSVYIEILGFGIPLPRQEIEYKWLAANSGLPLVEVVTSVFLGNETVTRIRYRDVPNGVEGVLAQNQPVTLYPQPATRREKVSFSDFNVIK